MLFHLLVVVVVSLFFSLLMTPLRQCVTRSWATGSGVWQWQRAVGALADDDKRSAPGGQLTDERSATLTVSSAAAAMVSTRVHSAVLCHSASMIDLLHCCHRCVCALLHCAAVRNRLGSAGRVAVVGCLLAPTPSRPVRPSPPPLLSPCASLQRWQWCSVPPLIARPLHRCSTVHLG